MKPKSLFYRWLERVLPYLLAICAASQRNQICIWAIFESVKPMMVTRSFVIHGTGHPVDDTGLEHIGTVLMDDWVAVFHVFEKSDL
jgi:hypothetical protein